MRGIISLVIAAIACTLLTGSMVAGAIESSDFDDPAVCKGCHAEIYNQWDGSMHSIAYTDPVYLKEEEMAGAEGTIEVGKEPGEGVPGFEVLLVLISLLVVAYLVRRREK